MINLFPYRLEQQGKQARFYWGLCGLIFFMAILSLLSVKNFLNREIEQRTQNLKQLQGQIKIIQAQQKTQQIKRDAQKIQQANQALLNQVDQANQRWEVFFKTLPNTLPSEFVLKKLLFENHELILEGEILDPMGLTYPLELEQWLAKVKPLGSFQSDISLERHGRELTMKIKEEM